MTSTSRLPRMLIWFLACGLCVGCLPRSQPVQFYSLQALESLGESPRSAARFLVTLGPVTVPDMLRRPQIASLQPDNRVHFSEFHQWAGNLSQDIRRVMVENLVGLLAPKGGMALSDDQPVKADYRVMVSILRLEGTDESLRLHAVWSLKDLKGTRGTISHPVTIAEPVDGPGYERLVDAHNRAIFALCRVIAEAVPAAG